MYPVPAMSLPPGTRIGPYEIVRMLGAGGMGEVYQGHDPRLGRHVAVKVLTREFAADPGRLRRFELEARAAAALSHPNILAVYDVGTHGSLPYLVSEFLEGQTLREALNQGALPFGHALDLARQISSGLMAAHGRGIVHRDLKPENVFLTTNGHAKILDFGIAKFTPGEHTQTFVGSDATEVGAIVGTVGYMAPEQAMGRTVDFRCDQFAFGVVVYEMLSGRRTFERKSHVEELAAIVRDEPPPISELRPEAPLPLQWMLNRCLAKDPAGRYGSTHDLHQDLEALATHVLQGVAPPTTAPDVDLPLPRTSFIGREADIVRARQIVLREGVRLMTFTGPGGTGKTRLALQVASDVKTEFSGGVAFAPLSTITDTDLVPEAVAQALGVTKSPDGSLLDAIREHLVRARGGAATLLVLDGFEHLLGAVPFVVALLKIDAPLKIVATSREPLHLYGEHEVPVHPLPRPESGPTVPLDVLARNPAVMLFVERATTAKPDFKLTSDNARSIAEICNRLDGLPLAIELAAARIKTLPPAAMLGRLESRLQILTGGARDLPERQQTLRGAIAWSHDLLTEPEQRLFRRIAVFVGGCTFEAAEAVADAKQDVGVDVIDGIESLLNKSLVQLVEQPDGEPRLTLLETVREFGRERLAESEEGPWVRKAHAAYFLVVAEEAAGAMDGPDQGFWLQRLDRDRDDIRAALEWLTRAQQADWGLRLAAAMLRYWELREQFTEGRARLKALLALPTALAPTTTRAKAVFAAGVLAALQRDYPASAPLYEEALGIYRQLGDDRGAAVACNALALLQRERADIDGARKLLEESCALSLAVGDRLMYARTLSNLANFIRDQGDLDLALARHGESLALFRQLGDESGVAWSLRYHGDIARERRALDEARTLYEQALDLFRRLEDAWSIGSVLTDLGSLALEATDTASAHDRFREAVETFAHTGGHTRGLARALEGFAVAAAQVGDPTRAIRLAGAAAALRNAVGTPLTPIEQRQLEAGLEQAHEALGQAEHSKAWIEGWTMTLDQAVDYATAPFD
jgi:predicted ATPase